MTSSNRVFYYKLVDSPGYSVGSYSPLGEGSCILLDTTTVKGFLEHFVQTNWNVSVSEFGRPLHLHEFYMGGGDYEEQPMDEESEIHAESGKQEDPLVLKIGREFTGGTFM